MDRALCQDRCSSSRGSGDGQAESENAPCDLWDGIAGR